jgi:hypothetical protein
LSGSEPTQRPPAAASHPTARANGYDHAGKNCKPLQRERHAIFPATHSQVRELQFPLLVQMFSLEVDQVTLIPQESSRFHVHGRCAWG